MSESPSTRRRRPARPPGPPRQARQSPRYRRLVRCDACLRQFDAGSLAPGEKFRCVCGASLAVPRTAAQEAPVVRCASCGAPRAAGASNCTFCTAPFMLGEGARNTLCPVCASRLGDSQRFCHSCGTPIAPEAVAGEPTELACPSCKPARRLSSRQLADAKTLLAMLECGGCAGVWLGHRTFDTLQERAQREVTPGSFVRPGATSRPAPGKGEAVKVSYRPCPVCQKLMVRRNFAGTSGIVVDVCGADGLWFDAEELDSVLAWIRSGGLARAEERLAEERKEVTRREAIAKRTVREERDDETPEGHWLDLLGNLVDFVLGASGRLR